MSHVSAVADLNARCAATSCESDRQGRAGVQARCAPERRNDHSKTITTQQDSSAAGKAGQRAAFQQRAATLEDLRRPRITSIMSGAEMRCCIPSCPNQKPPSDASVVADDAVAEPRDADCRFFAVPTIGADDSVASDSGLRRALWLRRIKKCTIDFDPDTALLCNRHFVEGEASKGESFAERARRAVFPPQGASRCIVKKIAGALFGLL